MRVVQLQAENYKRLKAVQITPTGNVVTIGGNNGQGKSSVLDAIYVALKGRSVNPPRPVRDGEDKATIRVDLGELIVTRTFTVKDGKPYTDTLRVENAEGFQARNPQATLDALLGEIGFDPFHFAQKDAAKQIATILDMVPLTVDLDELADADTDDRNARRDINRDLAAKEGQIAGIPVEEVPEEAPDREALTSALAKAGETNTALANDRANRAARQTSIDSATERRDGKVAEAASLREQAARLDTEAAELTKRIDAATTELAALAAPGDPVDVSKLQQDLRDAETVLAVIERQRRRKALVDEAAALKARSEALTTALTDRAKTRTDALAKARMPVEGLGIDIDAKGAPFLTWEGLPFDKDQISTAVQLRVSTAIGMAANPTLRVLRIKDGSLLDANSKRMLAEMADTEDFQLWVEEVGDGGTGVIMENGEIRSEQAAEGEPANVNASPGEPVEPVEDPAQDGPTLGEQRKARRGKAKPDGETLL